MKNILHYLYIHWEGGLLDDVAVGLTLETAEDGLMEGFAEGLALGMIDAEDGLTVGTQVDGLEEGGAEGIKEDGFAVGTIEC